ncbi:hypothetical protein C9994_10425 [Marivirga lumbricoides]|uniref:Thioredoxin domain-containing protein n=1 Tax=Marivirga lumbricoides TaxID=1046115 RepID=A0A2T4DPS1_9BACT|nr:hypothetical protein C9994_10425 [Marivirga lumbricoides]
MKSRNVSALVLLIVLLSECSSLKENILQKTNIELQKLTSVTYKTEYKNYNPFNGDLVKSYSAETFFDFKSEDSIIGVKYYFNSGQFDYGFNGYYTFYTKEEKKQIIYRTVSVRSELIGIQFLQFSIQNLRDIIPEFLNDSNRVISQLNDTLINKSECFQFDIVEKNSEASYKIYIDKMNYYPKLFIQYLNDEALWEVSYNDFDVLSTISDSLFNYWEQGSDYLIYSTEEHQIAVKSDKKIDKSAITREKAKDWTLPSMDGDSVTLSKIESNLVLIEFWFPYCTGCVSAIPDINEIQKKYKREGLTVYGIEFTKSDSIGLANYIAKYKIESPSLFAGKKVASDYRVLAGPTFFLINKEGEFVYKSEGFFRVELIEAIEKNL